MFAIIVIMGFISVLMFAVPVFIVYKIIYDRHMNKALEQGKATGRKWLAPGVVFIGVLAIMMIGLIFVTAAFGALVFVRDSRTTEYSEQQEGIVIEVSDSVNYVPDGGEYELVQEGQDQGVDFDLYKSISADGSIRYLIIAHYACDSAGMNEIECGYNTEFGGTRAARSYPVAHADPDICMMAEIPDSEYHPGNIVLKISSGSHVTEINLDI
ncbi:hypothetical protein SAMN02910456_00070 [Ruminococcaceae bacterium YRB3002]|nr:hypothetical protein SAMN02910456_00070 [Ruminococcaceae bacterium YRB3002]